MYACIQEFAMHEQPGFSSSLRVGVSWLVLAALLLIFGCGDPAAGTIKAPKRDEMSAGGPSGGAPVSGAKVKKQGRREVELKTITPGGKKM
jgi:hypothetical protein